MRVINLKKKINFWFETKKMRRRILLIWRALGKLNVKLPFTNILTVIDTISIKKLLPIYEEGRNGEEEKKTAHHFH